MRCFCTPSWSSPAVAETSSLWGVRGALNSALDRVERDSPICGIMLILRERELYTALDAVFCFPVSTWGLFPVNFFTFFVVILLFTDNNNHFSWCFISLQDDMSDSLRDYTNLPEAAPLLTILDMSARAKYVKDVEEITPAVVEQFVSDFLAEKLKPEPIWSPWTRTSIWPLTSRRALSSLPVRLFQQKRTLYWHFTFNTCPSISKWPPPPVVPCIYYSADGKMQILTLIVFCHYI